MAASTNFLSVPPQTLFLHRSNSAAASAPSLFTNSSIKPLPKLALALSSSSSRAQSTSKFVRYVAFSSYLEEDGSGAEEQNSSPDAKLFVGNLPFNVDSAALAELFVQAGRSVEQVEVIYDKATGRSRGFGFVVMSSPEEAEAAAEQFNGYELDGRPLRVNSGPPPPKTENSSFGGSRGREREWDRPRSGSTNKIYVGNLAWGVDDLALETAFSKYGTVREARVVYDRENGRSRGFGFVTYNSAEEVNNAVEELNGSDLDGRTIRVSPAEDRR